MQFFYNSDIQLVNACVAVGAFDGVHNGHMAVIDMLVSQTTPEQKSVLVVADKHDDTRKNLTTRQEKEHLLQNCGVDIVLFCCANVDDIYSKHFFADVLINKLGMRQMVVGENCNYIARLQKYAAEYHFALIKCKTITENGSALCTSKISRLLVQGEAKKANRLLGHPYVIAGKVVHGKGLGRTAGMPTANIGFAANKLLPKSGVYSTKTTIDGKTYTGLTSIGRRPSVDNSVHTTIETYVLGFRGDLYGKTLILEVHEYIRGIIKLSGLAELRQQIDKDIIFTKKYFDKK